MSYVLNSQYGVGWLTHRTKRYPGPDALYEYDLFAVICHEGQIDNGHYTNFARFQEEVSCRSICLLKFLPVDLIAVVLVVPI